MGDRSSVNRPVTSDRGALDPKGPSEDDDPTVRDDSHPRREEQKPEDAITRLRLELAAKRAEEGGAERVIDLTDRASRRVRRISLRLLKYLVVLGMILVAAEVVYVGWTLRSGLLDTQSSLSRARSAFLGGDYDAAHRYFVTALEDAEDATRLQQRPGAWVLRHAPGISSDARVADVLTSVAQLASRAGIEAVDLYDRLGVTSSGLAGAFFDNGRVRMGSFDVAHEEVVDLVDLLSEADALLAADLRPTFDSVREAFGTARSQVDSSLTSLRRAESLLGAVPTLLGRGGPRRYLLIIQHPSQSRSTGGVISYYGELEASNGRVRMGDVRPISALERRPDSWRNLNVSADFPAVARSVLSRYRNRTGRRLDGVLATDPLVMQKLISATGPVRERGFDVAVSSENAAQVLMHDVTEHFGTDKAARDRYVAAVVEKVWKAVARGVADTSVLFDALVESAEQQRLKVFSTTAVGQEVLEELAVSGDPRLLGHHVQMITQNNRTQSEVDFFLRREIETAINLNEDGSADIRVSTTIQNLAPAGPPSLVLGFDRPGEAHLSLGALLPATAGDVGFAGGVGYKPRLTSGFGNRPVLTVDIRVPPGSTRETIFTYSLPPPEASSEGGSRFRLVMLPQALAWPDRAAVELAAPPGFCINSCDRPSSTRVGATKTLTEPWTVTARLVPAP
jgi:hypothetical protein